MFIDVTEEVSWGPYVQILIIKWFCFPPKRGLKCPSYCSKSQNDCSCRENADFCLDGERAPALIQTQEAIYRTKLRHPLVHWALRDHAMSEYWSKTKTQLCPWSRELTLQYRPDHLQQEQGSHPDRRDTEQQTERELAPQPQRFGVLTSMSQEMLETELLPCSV